MDKFYAAIGVIFAGLVSLFMLALVSTFFGGLGLWIIGSVFEYIPDLIREHTGTEFTNFQLGAIIGYTTAMIRSMLYRGG